MRKITLLMSLLCLWCVGATAEVITSMSQLANNRCYTVVTPKAGWAMESGGTISCTVALGLQQDANDEKQQFAFVNDGHSNYYLYSVSEKKFLTMDKTMTTSLADIVGNAIEFVEAGGNYPNAFRIRFRDNTSKNINLANPVANGVVIDGWSYVDDGTAYTITDVGEFNPEEALEILSGTKHFTYNYTLNGVTIGTEVCSGIVGEDFPIGSKTQTGYVTMTKPDGKISADSEGKTYYVPVTFSSDFPFLYSSSDDENLNWYFLKLKDLNQNARYIKYDADRTDKYAVTADFTTDDCYLWAFIGNPVEGFAMVNKATGEQKLYAATLGNDQFPTMSSSDETKWVPIKSERGNYNGRFGLKASTAEFYLNDFAGNGFLSLWEQGPTPDEGSNVLAITEADGTKAKFLSVVEGLTTDLENKPFGEGLGKYHLEGDESIIEKAKALKEKENATFEEIKDCLSELQTVVIVINQPVPGKFYRFKNADGSKCMTSTEVSNKMQMATANNNNAAPTVFYLDNENHLVAFSNGLCIGQFERGKENESWKCLLATNEKVGTAEFQESGAVGLYNICMSKGRYLYNAHDDVDCGGSDGDGYRWTIEEVTWLPVPINTAVGYASLFSPVELKRSDNSSNERVKAYTGTVSGDFIKLTEIEGNIPANTPVVLEYVRDEENGYVYLPIVSTDAASTATTSDNDNCFTGEVLAENYTPGNGICTLQKIDEEVGFYGYNGDTLYGFKAYLPAQGSGVRGYAIKFGGEATGIDGIEAEKNASEIFYDLNGRRVLYPAAGIYVTASGKKVLVK